MAATNDVTGDRLVSKANNKDYRDNYDKIFGKKDADKKTASSSKTVGDYRYKPI